MRKYNLFRENLKEGQRITIAMQGWVGGIWIIKTTYSGCEPAPHYVNCPEDKIGVKIVHKLKGKKNMCETTIDYISPIVVYDGWVDIDTESIIYENLGNGRKISRYAMTDRRMFDDLLAKYPDPVIFSDIRVEE